ncbi:hypothetical protein BHE74_00034890, partial [Ensete ventricosum]
PLSPPSHFAFPPKRARTRPTTMRRKEAVVVWRPIPGLGDAPRRFPPPRAVFASVSNGGDGGVASGVRDREKDKEDGREREAFPSPEQLLRHPLALLALVPDGAALFTAGAIAGAAAKTLTAPLDRAKLLMQACPTHGLRAVERTGKKAIGFIDVKASNQGRSLIGSVTTYKPIMPYPGWPFHPYSLSCLDSPVTRIAWSILVYSLVILLIKASIVCSIRLTTFDMVKSLISSGQKELERISEGNKVKLVS